MTGKEPYWRVKLRWAMVAIVFITMGTYLHTVLEKNKLASENEELRTQLAYVESLRRTEQRAAAAAEKDEELHAGRLSQRLQDIKERREKREQLAVGDEESDLRLQGVAAIHGSDAEKEAYAKRLTNKLLRGVSKRLAEERTNAIVNDEFSYVRPDGWTCKEFPGLKYRIAAGPVRTIGNARFTPNISVVDEKADMPLDDYWAAAIKTLRLAYPKAITNRKGKLDTGTPYITIVRHEVPIGKVRQTLYLFAGRKTKKFVVTGTSPAEDGTAYDQIFDTAVQTFRVR